MALALLSLSRVSISVCVLRLHPLSLEKKRETRCAAEQGGVLVWTKEAIANRCNIHTSSAPQVTKIESAPTHSPSACIPPPPLLLPVVAQPTSNVRSHAIQTSPSDSPSRWRQKKRPPLVTCKVRSWLSRYYRRPECSILNNHYCCDNLSS